MPAQLNLVRSDVTIDGEVTSNVQIVIRNMQARLMRGSTRLLTKDDATGVQRSADRKTWTVSFADGSVWTVARKAGGCGCR